MELKTLLALHPQPSGQYTATAPWPNPYHREQANDKSQDGDVISVTPEGEIQTRPKGTAGAWELFSLDGILMKFQAASDSSIYVLTVTGF